MLHSQEIKNWENIISKKLNFVILTNLVEMDFLLTLPIKAP